MSRFYFHTEDGVAYHDDEGVELRDMAQARREAVRVLGEMLKEQPDALWADGLLKLTVTDDSGLVLFVLDASATLAPAGGPLPRP